MKEVWKDIEEYEGLYQVSSFGRVKRVKTNRVLKGSKHTHGYLVVGLLQKKTQIMEHVMKEGLKRKVFQSLQLI